MMYADDLLSDSYSFFDKQYPLIAHYAKNVHENK